MLFSLCWELVISGLWVPTLNLNPKGKLIPYREGILTKMLFELLGVTSLLLHLKDICLKCLPLHSSWRTKWESITPCIIFFKYSNWWANDINLGSYHCPALWLEFLTYRCSLWHSIFQWLSVWCRNGLSIVSSQLGKMCGSDINATEKKEMTWCPWQRLNYVFLKASDCNSNWIPFLFLFSVTFFFSNLVTKE